MEARHKYFLHLFTIPNSHVVVLVHNSNLATYFYVFMECFDTPCSSVIWYPEPCLCTSTVSPWKSSNHGVSSIQIIGASKWEQV